MRLLSGACAATFVAATASAQIVFARAASAQSVITPSVVTQSVVTQSVVTQSVTASDVSAHSGSAPETGARASSPPIDSTRLTRQQVILEALQHNAALDIASEQTAQARARRVSATSIPDPTATASFDQIASPLRFGGAPSRPAGIELAVPFPDKFRLNARAGSADIRANEHNYRLQQQLVVLQASAAYDSLLLSHLRRSFLRESRELAADFLQRTEARFNAGTAAKLDQIQAQVTVAQADNDLIGNERDIANAEASLNRAMGRTAAVIISPADSLGVVRSLPNALAVEQLALGNRPELAMLREQRTGARATTSLAREFWLPDITFGVARDYAGGGGALFTTGLSFPLPVFYWQHARGDIAQATHYERELAATERDARAAVLQDVRIAYANASTSARQVAFIREQLVPAATEAYRIASTSYALGGSSALEVLNARSALLAAQSQLADALANANTSRSDLDRALGIPVTTSGATNR